MQNHLLSNEEAAQYLNLSPRTLEKWRCIGGGPKFIKMGRRAMYRPSDLSAFCDSRSRKSTSDPGPRDEAA